jgi:hypothetical protein
MGAEMKQLIFNSGLILARKWGGKYFEKWLTVELQALGFSSPDIFPGPVPVEWQRYADFSNEFMFAKARWS